MTWSNTVDQRFRNRLFHWLLILIVGFLGLFITGCDLPQVTAEERLFLNLSLDFLGEYRLPKMEFEKTPVGGLSAIAYDPQRDRFYALSDDRSDFAPARFYTLKLDLDQSNPKQPKLKQVSVESVTTLKDQGGKPFAKGTVDTEGLVLSPQRSLFIASEGIARSGIPPFIQEFDLKTGQERRSLPIPDRYLPASKDGQPTQGVQDNLGFESLTANPGGAGMGLEPFRLFTATESSLVQDADPLDSVQGPRCRLLHYLVEEGRSLLVSEHLYPLETPPLGAKSFGLVELLAIDQGGHFLSLERTFGPSGFGIKVFQLATGGATDTSSIPSFKGALRGVQPIRKQLLLDLNQLGIVLDNLEGIALGPQLPDGSQSLVLVSDDNFNPQQVTQFLLFRLKGVAR